MHLIDHSQNKMSAPYTELAKPISDLALLCRGCLIDSGEMKNMIEWGLADEFYKYTEIRVMKSDEISELICSNCEEQLLKCGAFRMQCKQADQLLMTRVKKKDLETACLNQDYDVIQNNKESLENTVSWNLYETGLVINVVAPNMTSKIHFTCPYNTDYRCKEAFQKKKYLMMHLVKTHGVIQSEFSVEVRFYCSLIDCSYNLRVGSDKWFSERKYLNQHFNKVHRDKKVVCTNCDFTCATNVELERHNKTCNLIYKCDICDIEYKTNESLLVHLMRKHPDLHEQYKRDKKAKRKVPESYAESKKPKTELERVDYICDSPKRSFATQTFTEDSVRNDVNLWNSQYKSDNTKTDEISTQTVFEDLLSLKSQTSEDDSIFFSETVSLSDIQTQTFPIEFGLHRSNKETITSETQSPDLSIKETQTCVCLCDGAKVKLDAMSTSQLASTHTQTTDRSVRDVLLCFSSTETQTCFEGSNI